MKEKYLIYNCDSLKFIKSLKDNNVIVDHIITDPPYNISKKNNFTTLSNPRKGIFFGEWDKKFDIVSWIQEYISILKENGSIIIFCSYKFVSFITSELERCGVKVKDIIVWKKTNPMPRNTNRRYVQDLEFAIWGVNGKEKWVFNKPINIPYLRSTFETSIVSGKEKTMHPTQKSLKLMSHLIKIHSNKNDIILDPFMGSGTTGVAALLNGRKFIGLEKEKKFFEISKKRLNDSML